MNQIICSISVLVSIELDKKLDYILIYLPFYKQANMVVSLHDCSGRMLHLKVQPLGNSWFFPENAIQPVFSSAGPPSLSDLGRISYVKKVPPPAKNPSLQMLLTSITRPPGILAQAPFWRLIYLFHWLQRISMKSPLRFLLCAIEPCRIFLQLRVPDGSWLSTKMITCSRHNSLLFASGHHMENYNM